MATVAEIFAFLELAAIWLIIALRYRVLPAMIRSPFNGGGDAHGLAGKDQLWLLAILSLIGYIFLTAIPRLPLPVNVPAGTPESTIASLRLGANRLLLAIKTLVLAMMLWLTIITIQPVPAPWRHGVMNTLLVILIATGAISGVRLVRLARSTSRAIA